MKPMSASEVLKTRNYSQVNIYEVLRSRNDSVVADAEIQKNRDRANSIKRKASGDINENAVKKPNQIRQLSVDCEKLERMDKKLKMLKGICGKLNEDAAKVKLDPALEGIIRIFCEYVDVSCSLHEDLMSSCTVEIPDQQSDTVFAAPENESQSQSQNIVPPTQTAKPQNSYSLAAAKKPTKVTAPAPARTVNHLPKKDPKLQAFEDAVQHAERSTLVFNLDLGNNKTLNERTILTKATLALSAAAAETEGNKGKQPSKASVAALDDIMSVTQNVTLFGKVTKPYENPRNSSDPKKTRINKRRLV
jgi:hypothetical protein